MLRRFLQTVKVNLPNYQMRAIFTKKQVDEASFRVKTGADFPKFVQDLKSFGVQKHDFFVERGDNVYYGKDDFSLPYEPQYPPLKIAEKASKEKFGHFLLIHQQGKTDFPTFCKQVGEAGVAKWVSDFDKKVVIYYDREGNEVSKEPLP
jgi:uncharacterized protein YbcV (DUF1398 family)